MVKKRMVIVLPSEQTARYSGFLIYYFDIFESEFYAKDFVSKARDKFVAWALKSTNIEQILDDYVRLEMRFWRSDYL